MKKGFAVLTALVMACLCLFSARAAVSWGDRGSEVRALQARLAALNCLLANGVDGIFGGKTYNAVRRFQNACGMSETGVATVAV